MDFDFDTSPPNDTQNNNTSNQPEESKLTNLDQMLNMDFQPFTEQNQDISKNETNQELNMNFMSMNNINSSPPKIDEEEQIRISDRKKEEEERKQKINEKIKKEEELRNEIRKKAAEYLVEFEQKRQENIALRRKALEEKNSETNNIKSGESNSDSWQKINSNIDLKDSDYKGSKDVNRMREAMMNRKNDTNSEPIKNFFG